MGKVLSLHRLCRGMVHGHCRHCKLGCRFGWTPLWRCATSASCHQVRWGTLSVLAHKTERSLSALQAGLPLRLYPSLLLLCLLRNVSILPTDPAGAVLLGRDDGVDVLHSFLQLPITVYNNCTAELSDCQQVLTLDPQFSRFHASIEPCSCICMAGLDTGRLSIAIFAGEEMSTRIQNTKDRFQVLQLTVVKVTNVLHLFPGSLHSRQHLVLQQFQFLRTCMDCKQTWKLCSRSFCCACSHPHVRNRQCYGTFPGTVE